VSPSKGGSSAGFRHSGQGRTEQRQFALQFGRSPAVGQAQLQLKSSQPPLQHVEKMPHGPSFVQRQRPSVQRLLFSLHRSLQPPQLSKSVWTFRQLPPQQVWPLAQLVPHAPQAASSDFGSTHEPPQQS